MSTPTGLMYNLIKIKEEMKRAMIIIYHTIYPVFYWDEDDYLASSSANAEQASDH